MSTDPDLRLIRIRAREAISDALHADVCQLTITGTVHTRPEVIEDYDGEPVCCIVLTRTIDHPESGHWELQHHHVHVRGPIGEMYAETHRPGERIVVCGRLDSPALDTHGIRIGPTWIIASHLTVLDRERDG
jgi:hypothetical protein